VKCCVWNTALCGTETWALWKVDRKLMKVGAPNRILWRTRFRRGYGSVARQTDRQTDRMMMTVVRLATSLLCFRGYWHAAILLSAWRNVNQVTEKAGFRANM
jgi:hypothetical protein